MDTEDKNQRPALRLSSAQQSSLKQRAALHSLLAQDEEYSDLVSHIEIDPSSYDILGSEMDKLFESKGLISPATITQILQYDVQGYNPKLIAKLMNLTPEQILRIKASDAYQISRTELLNAVVSGARKYMEVATIKAVKTLVQCMDSPNEKVRLAASQDVLNRAGLQAPTQIEISTQVNNFEGLSDEELAEILRKEKAIPANGEVLKIGTSTTVKG